MELFQQKKKNLLYSNSANYRYAGYHKIDLEEPISFKQVDVYLIVLTESIETEEGIYYSVFADSQLTKDGKIKAIENAKEKNT